MRATLAALRNLDAVKALVETTGSPDAAETGLMQLLDIDQTQARAVLDLQLRALSPPRRQQHSADYDRVLTEQADLASILASADRLRAVVALNAARIWPGTTNAGGPVPWMTTGRGLHSAQPQVQAPDGCPGESGSPATVGVQACRGRARAPAPCLRPRPGTS